MPELPEIETITNGLRRFVLNTEISTFLLKDKKLALSLSNLKKIKADSFIQVDRLGKMMVFSLAKSNFKLAIHLKMTGQLIFCPVDAKKATIAGGHSEKKVNNLNCQDLKYIRFGIIFKNGDKLFLNDARRFAYVKLFNPDDFLKVKEKFGLEPVNEKFVFKDFAKIITQRPNKNIKAFLLDQSLVAGIGNIYADEILFASQVSPFKKVGFLSEIQIKAIFRNIGRILKLAVAKRGTTFSDYVDAQGQSGGFLKLLKVYGRDGQRCLKCHSLVAKAKVAGRGTHYCPKCQKN